MLSKKIEQARGTLRTYLEEEAELKTRSEELESAIEEAETEEEISTVESEVEELEKEKTELEEKKSKLEGEIADLEGQLEELNSKKPKNNQTSGKERSYQGGETVMRRGFFKDMTRAEVDTLIAREEVKEFLERTRELVIQKRAVTGAELLIPEIMLDFLRDNIATSSKLITKINYKPLKGKARQNISGTVPEAVWTEMVDALNELEMNFNQVEVDGYKVGGFIPIPNSILKDSDINLASEIMTQFSKAIGMALDKAILYGVGTKQPLGIVTRLAQASEPSGYPADAPVWKDLRTTNITKVSTTGAALIGSIITAFGACKNDFSDGRKFFAMNSVTHAHLVTTLLNFNAAGALATGMSNQMPILGGDIVILDFISDNDIVGGYGDLYLLVEREGTVLTVSEHVRFIEDQTVFKGLARYDGLPVIAEGFFVINIDNTDAATSKTFEFDYANTGLDELTVTSVAGADSGETKITVSGQTVGNTNLHFKTGIDVAKVKAGDKLTNAWTDFGSTPNFTTGVTIDELTADHLITVVEFDAKNKAVKAGVARIVVNAS